MDSEPPTLRDFEWDEPRPVPKWNPDDGDGWCARDAFCQLFGWPRGSDEWNRFMEGITAGELDRLTEHLGLAWFDPEYEPHREVLETSLDHPGVAVYAIHSHRMSHCAYEPHLRYLQGLPVQYWDLEPELFRFIVDLRQPPRSGAGAN